MKSKKRIEYVAVESIRKSPEESGITIGCKSFNTKIKRNEQYFLIRFHDQPFLSHELKIGTFEQLSLLSAELAEYVKNHKKGGTV